MKIKGKSTKINVSVGWWPYLGYFRLRKSQFCLRDPCATRERKEINGILLELKGNQTETNGMQWKSIEKSLLL